METLEAAQGAGRPASADGSAKPVRQAVRHGKPSILIEPQVGWVGLDLAELWRYRDLLFQMVWRDYSARYRQSLLGFGWAIVTPVVTMIIFTVVFGKMVKVSTGGDPYPIFSFAGLLPWTFFSGCLTRTSSSTIVGSSLLTKVYFPRLILPLSKAISGLIDFGVQFCLLLVLMAWYGIVPSARILSLPLFLGLSLVAAFGVGLWATALSVRYRDVQHLIQFVAQMWLWITPVAYPVTLVPEYWRLIYWMNPMVGVIEGFRWGIVGKAEPDWAMLAVSTGVAVLACLGGLFYFRRMEASFADVV